MKNWWKENRDSDKVKERNRRISEINSGHIVLERTKKKMKENHADFSGKNNPMYGRKPGRKDQQGINNPNWKGGISYCRENIFKKKQKKCERCGIKEIKVLLVHHKDRNRKNNKIENIEILCRNCHILEHYEEINKRKTKQKRN